ncbi:MAG TPA: helix-turn-helix transcriptional regulator [Terriglobales bacterium]|nr:helix-turn-helix transcriptional regulator [Terriglobales bacterium]
MAQTARSLFGNRIKNLREKRELTQEEFAARAGYTRSYVSLVENGHYSTSLDAIVAFANVLKVRPADLLKGIS